MPPEQLGLVAKINHFAHVAEVVRREAQNGLAPREAVSFIMDADWLDGLTGTLGAQVQQTAAE